jgi:hypothetical protein
MYLKKQLIVSDMSLTGTAAAIWWYSSTLTVWDPSMVTVGTNAHLRLSRCKAITGTVGRRTTNRLNIKIEKYNFINHLIINYKFIRIVIIVWIKYTLCRWKQKQLLIALCIYVINKRVFETVILFICPLSTLESIGLSVLVSFHNLWV